MPLPGTRGRRCSAAQALSYSLAGLALVGAGPPKPQGELVLDAADPVLEVMLSGVPVRLRVDLAQHDVIELNPAAAARLPIAWAKDRPIDVGRIRLEGHSAMATIRVGERAWPIAVAEHGRDCCTGADGAVGPDLLPFASVRWRRADAPTATGESRLVLRSDPATGLSAALPKPLGGLRVRFNLAQPVSEGTAAAGAILARDWGGRWGGPPMRLKAAFGVERPARVIAFARPVTIAGFRFTSLLVRIADFGGREVLPAESGSGDEIVVSRTIWRQRAWPAITLGADRLQRCAEIVYAARARRLTLRCAFE